MSLNAAVQDWYRTVSSVGADMVIVEAHRRGAPASPIGGFPGVFKITTRGGMEPCNRGGADDRGFGRTDKLGAIAGTQPASRRSTGYQIQPGQPRSECATWPGEHLARWALFHHAATFQYHHAVCEDQRDHLMGHDDG